MLKVNVKSERAFRLPMRSRIKKNQNDDMSDAKIMQDLRQVSNFRQETQQLYNRFYSVRYNV